MIKGKGRVPAFIAVVAIGGAIVSGCSASVTIGKATVAKNDLQTEVAETLAKQANQATPPKVVCPGDLDGKVGTVIYCTLTAPGDSTSYPVQVKVTSVKGTDVKFDALVSATPDHFTAPS